MWIMEQPAGSLLQEHPRFASLCKMMPIFKIKIKMGEYGAETEKATWLYSNYKYIETIVDYKVRDWSPELAQKPLVTSYIDQNGVKRCTGTAELKASQAFSRIGR